MDRQDTVNEIENISSSETEDKNSQLPDLHEHNPTDNSDFWLGCP